MAVFSLGRARLSGSRDLKFAPGAHLEHDIVGCTNLDSDVPLLYVSWTDFNIFAPYRFPKVPPAEEKISAYESRRRPALTLPW